jgi:hypothetical protein
MNPRTATTSTPKSPKEITMRTTKNRLTLLAAGTGAAALAVAGLALPASADDTTSSVEESTTTTTTDLTSDYDAFQTWVSEALNANGSANEVSPNTGVGDVTLVEGPLVGDVLTGPIGSGNQAPIGSGNETPIGSGNEVSAPVGSGNDTAVDAPVGSGNDVSAGNGNSADGNASGNEAGNGNSAGNGNEVGSGNESSTDTGISVGDIGADVDNLVDDVTSDLGLGDILG